MKTAYEDVTHSEPFLPFTESVLPALLAMRKTHSVTIESQEYLGTQQTSLDEAKKRLQAEQSNLRDHELLRNALESRLEGLKSGLEASAGMSAKQIGKEKIDELKRRKAQYDQDTTTLLHQLRAFIDEHMGPMLAAEQLGGPVVGDLMEVDEVELRAGFTAQGKLKKPRAGQEPDKRQRRLPDVWGNNQDGPAAAASAEMQDLTGALVNKLRDSDGDSSAAYVTLTQESAAARFLVRAKVAQFHPKDATRLRLVDFGRELED